MPRKQTKTVTARGESKAPEKLARFIELVNAERLFERELQDPLRTALYDPRMESGSSGAYVQLVTTAADSLSSVTRRFLGPPSDIEKFTEKYLLLRSAGEALVDIARRNCPARSDPSVLTVRDAKGLGREFPVSVSVTLVINEDGIITNTQNDLLDALIGIRADRVRMCAICSGLFWAPRVNSECCTEQCRKTYNQRNSRQNKRFRRRKRK